jgi:hypothetical protein
MWFQVGKLGLTFSPGKQIRDQSRRCKFLTAAGRTTDIGLTLKTNASMTADIAHRGSFIAPPIFIQAG